MLFPNENSILIATGLGLLLVVNGIVHIRKLKTLAKFYFRLVNQSIAEKMLLACSVFQILVGVVFFILGLSDILF